MTQIFTGQGLGLHGSSLGLGSYGPKGSAALGQGGESVYVNAANGNLVLRQSDGFMADIGFGLDLFQTYNSRGKSGASWCFNMQSRLEVSGEINTKGSSITRVDEDGHRSSFHYDAKKKAYLPDDGGTAQLTFNKGEWVYHEGKQKTSCYYNQDGQLTHISDLDGHSVYLKYDKGLLTTVIDQSGKQKITWSFKNGLLQDVKTTSNGILIHHLHYEYDEHNRLHKVSRDLGQGKSYWITYTYEGDSDLISDIRQSDGTSLHIEYDEKRRVKKLVDGEGRVSIYEYGEGKTTVTNGKGDSWTYFYDDKNRLTGIEGPENYRIRYYYEGNHLSSIVQGDQVWKFRYNDQGDCIYIEEPSGQITKRSYDSEHRLVAETQYQSFDGNHHPIHPKTTRYIYDKKGHLLFVIAADGTVTEHRYDEQGQLASSRTYLKKSINVNTLDEDQTISLEEMLIWVNKQDLQSVSLTEYKYDWLGQLTEEIRYEQVNSSGQGVQKNALRTHCRYDAAGRLVEKSVPFNGGWSTTQYFYDDLGRLIQTIDNHNNIQRIEYDDEHHRIIKKDTNGLQTISIYDRSGLLLSVLRLDNSHQYGSTVYKYDEAGRLITETGPDGLSCYYFYDAQGRLKARVNSSGLVTEYVYNNEGLLLQTHQYQRHVAISGWSNKLPPFEQIRPASSANDRISQTVYNEYNQIAYSINAEGAIIAYEYDAQGNLIKSTAYAQRLKNYQPEQILKATDIHIKRDLDDRVKCYYYDVLGRQIAEINGEGYATSYRYDRLGNLIEKCRYSNPVGTTLTGDWQNDKPLSDASRDVHTYALYDARGFKTADIDAEGYITEYRYNEQGLIQEKCSYEHPVTIPVSSDEITIEQIRPSAQRNDHHSYYTYNDLGLLIEEKSHTGLVTRYSYDEMKQLESKSLLDTKAHAVREQRYRYDALGRIIRSLDEAGCALLDDKSRTEAEIEQIWLKYSIHYEYNNAGLLSRKINVLQQPTYYFYDEEAQLKYVINADGGVTETHYNEFNQLSYTRKYSAFLKSKIYNLNTKDIEEQLLNIKNDRYDEVTAYTYNTLGLLIAKHSGTQADMKTEYNAFGEIEFTIQRLTATSNKIIAMEYDRRGLLVTRIDDFNGIEKNNTFKYDSFGWVTKKTDGISHSISFVLNKRGEQIIIENTNHDAKALTYDAFGRVLTESYYNKDKVRNQFSYDDENQTLTLIHPYDHSQVITHFNAFGDKITVKDANGYSTDFHYDERGELIRVNTPEGGYKKYTYDEAGNLIIQKTGDQIITYTYDASGHVLSKVIDPDGLKIQTSYQYDGIGRQLQIIEANGLIKQFTYDSQGNLIKSCVDPENLNLITEYFYDDRGLLIRQTEVNRQGKNKTTAYDWDHLGRRVATIVDPDGLNLKTTYSYDNNDNVICVTDANKHSTHYVFDANNQCHYQINARGVVTEYIYDSDGNQIQTITYAKAIDSLQEYSESSLKQIIQKSSQDQYQFRVYDGNGRLITSFNSSGYATTYIYDANGNLVYQCNYGKAVSIEHLKNGDMSLPTEENSRTQYYAYDGLNRLIFKCSNNGYVTESRYDVNGQLLSSTQYAQEISIPSRVMSADYIRGKIRANSLRDQTTRYAYNQAGWLILQVSAAGIAKTYQYNENGKLITSTQHALQVKATDSLEVIHNSNDRTTHFVYDDAGRECYRISGEGTVLERRYDDVGNIIQEITHATRIHQDIYTKESIDNVFKLTNENNKNTFYDYDAAGRLKTHTDTLKHAIKYEYDAQGNVTSKTDANQSVWTYHYDELNQLIETISPQIKVSSSSGTQERSVITRNNFDNFGNLITVIKDAEGLKQTVFYEYDNSNHRTKTIYPDVYINKSSNSASKSRQEVCQTLFEETQYNAFGEVIATRDKAGYWKHNAYDDQGLLLFSVDAQNAVTRFYYDSMGRLIKKTIYANPVQLSSGSEYDVDDIANAVQNSKYDRNETYQYDLDNRLIEVSRDKIRTYNAKTNRYDYLNPVTKNTYNAFGEVIKSSIKINESTWADTYTYYDKDGHKTAIIDPEGYVTSYSYTAFGDMDLLIEYDKRSKHYTTESYTEPQKSTKDRVVGFTYDEIGQLKSKTLKQVSIDRKKANGKSYETITRDLITTYAYDAMGHLTETTDAQGNSSFFYYDQTGQLIAKVAPKTREGRAATTYSYDALGNLTETRRWAQGVSSADNEHFSLKGASKQDIIIQQEYDVFGQVIAETDALNHSVYYSYDANGNMARSWQEFHQVDGTSLLQDKSYQYDKNNHLIQTATFKKNGTLKTEDAQYNSFGELIAKGIDGNYSTHVEYDLCGRVWRSNSQGYYQIYVYDLLDHVTQVVTSTNKFVSDSDYQGIDLSNSRFDDIRGFNEDRWLYDLQRQNNTYDALGHLLIQDKEYAVNSREKTGETRLEHMRQSQLVDRWGNILNSTNPLGHETRYEYNALNLCIRQEMPQVYVVDEHGTGRLLNPVNYYFYDELGRAIAMSDANGNTVSKEYDAMGKVIRETDAKGYSRDRHYNLLDQLESVTNELGGVTTYVYDAMNRLVSVTTPKMQQKYDYDELGQLIKQSNGAKEETLFWYDSLGNQVQRRDARGHNTLYEYDDEGHKTKETDALGHSQSWVYTADGYLKEHTDLGGHVITYKYNTNGLLLEQKSTAGQDIKYFYQGDGKLITYADKALHEVVDYEYDEAGQLISKESSRDDTVKDGWVRETDHYQYDALGRLIQVRRRNPADTDKRFPTPDRTLLAIDYEYDAVGNIRHSKLSANYTGYERINSDDYYTYDENNRMTINKGQLVKGNISITAKQGSALAYDKAGNILDATKYESNTLHKYHYVYNKENQLELIQKDGISLQSKFYDDAGRVTVENLFDARGNLAQKNVTSYKNGMVSAVSVSNSKGVQTSQTLYYYDNADNLSDLSLRVNGTNGRLGSTLKHHYTYSLWDSYQQSFDDATLSVDNNPSTTGRSTRSFDVNGQMTAAIDKSADGKGQTTTTYFRNSSIDGIRGRIDKNGQTNYLNVAGKTIGDLRLDLNKKQSLNVYSGFTPSGTHAALDKSATFLWRVSDKIGMKRESLKDFLGRTSEETAEGVAPEAPQDNLGAYTVQAGDTLESIALQVYGDSSLWYLIADANGISDKNAHASGIDQLHVGQRINLPTVATGQHHSNKTHKVLNANQMIGNISATTPLPPTPPPVPEPRKHHGIFSRIVVAVVAVVATVLTAGIIGALAGVTNAASLTSLFNIGTNVLAGGGMTSLSGSMAAGFTAGFTGSMASQALSSAMGLQNKIDFKGALINGLATAATAGLLRGIGASKQYKALMLEADKLSPTQNFSISSAATMLEQNSLSQGINLSLSKHQHFDWAQLGIAGLTAGFMGGSFGKKIDATLKKIDQKTGILATEAKALATGAAESAATGAHFNATDIITDHLGSAIGSAIVDNGRENSPLMPEEEELKNADELYLTDSLFDLAHPEWSQEQIERNYNEREAINNEFDFFRHMIENGKAKSPKSYGSLYGSDLLGFMEKTPNPETSVIGIGKGAFAIQDTDVVTMKQLKAMFPRAKSEILEAYLPEFNSQLAPAGINTPKRLAYFFATVNEETGGMTKFVENDFTYKNPERARNMFSNLRNMSDAEIKSLGNGELFANTAYANIIGNGGVSTGDGYFFRGRGLFHFTGRENYMKLGGFDFINNPELINIPANNVKSAIVFWDWKKMEKHVDVLDKNISFSKNGKFDNLAFKIAVKTVNSGMSNIRQRALFYNKYYPMFQGE